MKNRNRFIIISSLTLTLLAGWIVLAHAVLICGSPGASGPGSPNGVINDYWPGSSSPAAGNSSMTLGARRAGSAGNSIVAGDLVLIIQMQDADINSSNTANYGGSNGSGNGATSINSVGLYEYVLATNTVTGAGGTLNFTPALSNSYRTRNYTAGSNGQSRWQAIRVPQYSSATATNVTTPAWNGSTGGVVVMDVENGLTLSGATAINVAGLGFRGGAGRQLGGAAGVNTDFRTLASTTTNASKGEGIAGIPRYLNNTTAYNAAPNVSDTGTEGYPNGSYARGAPGNAGGGGTDGNPPKNDRNSGGGGGSNYGVGGQGGNAWNSGDPSGGRGGFGFRSVLASNRVFLGGGGGAGSTNNGTADPATYSSPPGLSCSVGTGACSSGAAGGGIILIRAGSISGGGAINARGADAYNVENDGAGGGGGGGTVVLQSYFGGNATVNVSGGNGGNAWRGHNILIDRHGPGGGGGGGFIAYSPSTGFAVSASYNAGLAGLSAMDDAFGSTSGNGGISTFDLPNVPGIQPGTFCPPAIKAATLAVDNGIANVVDPGDTIEYTVVYRNGSSGAISGLNITDALPAGMNFVTGSLILTPAGGASASANDSYNGTTSTSLLAANVTLPAGGIITAKLRATANAPACSNVYNQANSVQSGGADVLGLTDNADNIQNEGGLPSGTYIAQSPYGTGGTSDRTGITMGCPNLTTSTKSWIDLNGGDQVPGDVLRYTITVINSGGGNVSGVTVTDDIPPDVNSFAIVSIPAGATNSSTYAGTGSNLNGYVNVTNITVPAAGNVTIVFDVTINNGTLDGTTIDNTAVVTNPLGPGGTPPAPTVTVLDSFAPITGTKLLYLYDNASTPARKLSRTPTTSTNGISIDRGNALAWSMNPVAASPITINSTINSTVPVPLILRRGTRNGTNGNRSIRVDLQCSSGGTTLTDTRTVNLTNTRTVYTFNPTTATPWSVTCNASWNLTITNINAGGTVNDDMRVYPYQTGLTPTNSRVELPASTVINVDSITYYDAPYPAGNVISSAAPGQTVYIRATVSDPFGSYDINANSPTTLPTVTIVNPGGVTQLPATAMTELGALTTAVTKTFEYSAGYTIPGGVPTGNWTVRVDAVEGTEGTVSDYGIETLPVATPMPSLLVVKSSQVYSDPINGTTSPKAIPGAFVNYTILVTNFGPGSVDNNTTVITDPIPANTELFVGDFDGVGPALGPILFTNGATASGLSFAFTSLASTTDNLAFSGNNGTDLYLKNDTAPDSNECDPTVTNIKIPLSGIFNGSDGTNHPSFNVKFRVRIK